MRLVLLVNPGQQSLTSEKLLIAKLFGHGDGLAVERIGVFETTAETMGVSER